MRAQINNVSREFVKNCPGNPGLKSGAGKSSNFIISTSKLGCQEERSPEAARRRGRLRYLGRMKPYIRSMIAFSVLLGRIAAAHLCSSGK